MDEFDFSTPMMQQYAEIKKDYQDSLLFFRLGDFYELFMEDAKIGAEVLDITLTARDKGRDGRIPMCGVPFHSVDSYIGRLVHAGYKVAVCEQVTEADGSGIVEREVVRVITPGTILDENAVPGKEPNFLMVLDVPMSSKDEQAGVALVDIGTAQFIVTTVNVSPSSRELENLIAKFSPKECILSQKSYDNGRLLSRLRQFGNLNMYPFTNWDKYAQNAIEVLKNTFDVSSVESLGIKDQYKAQEVAAIAVGYIQETQKGKVKHLSFPQMYHSEEFVEMDRNTIFNLELFHTIREGEKEGSLIWLLDETKTAMGGRMLRDWLARPSRSIKEIESRLDVVEYFHDHYSQRSVTQELLENVQDIERILGRLNVGTGNARDLAGLRQSLVAIEELIRFLTDENKELFHSLIESFTEHVQEVKQKIQDAIKDEPAAQMRDGGMIREGYSSQLDDLRSITSQGKDYLDNYLESQKKATGIPNLKISSNKVFGFYLEVSKSHTAKVPDSYVRKQTLVNAERYITQELKEYEEKVFTAQDKIVALEYELVQQVIEFVVARTKSVIIASRQVARLDVLVGLAELAQRNNYVRPIVNETQALELVDNRHPVVEVLLEDEAFVPNDVYLDTNDNQIILLTGPNMAGKSTYIRQVAVTVLLSHIGSYVPCSKAEIGIVDKLFTRIGAADNLTRGLSTFMVEMIEVANILNHSTKNSLIILDEVGRGTSTYDGVSIAWAVVEYLAENDYIAPKTLFATHYHELLELSQKYSHVHNYQVVVEVEGDDLHFLHRVMPGGTDKSYGIQVAKRAGIPNAVINRANEILEQLEKDHHVPQTTKAAGKKKAIQPTNNDKQIELF